MNYAPRILIVALAFQGGVSLGAAQAELPKSSPFMSLNGPAAPTAAVEMIEFAAVRTIGPRTEIDLYDTQLKKNHWIPLGGSADGMSVLSYDARHDQIIAKIDGVNKTLRLRQAKGVAAGTAAVALQPAMSFNTPQPVTVAQPAIVMSFTPNNNAPTAETPPAPAPAAAPTTASTAPAPAPASTQPAVPLTVARQEEEARMLVSDLLEIGMAQRKAYEEKQKQLANPGTTPPAPANDTPVAAAKPNGG